MAEPSSVPTIDPNDSIFGVRGQPSGTLGAVDHIQRLVDIGVYLQWLKSVDVSLAGSITSLSSAIAGKADGSTLSALSTAMFNYIATISGFETWQTWNAPILYSTGTAVNLGTGGTTVGIYKHQGFDVEADFVVTWGSTSRTEGTGFHRINLPVPCDAFYTTNEGVLGYGHLHDVSIGSGLGPAAIFDVQFHTASALNDTQAGILLVSNQPGDAWLDNLTAGVNPFIGGIAAGDKYVGKLKYKAASHS